MGILKTFLSLIILSFPQIAFATLSPVDTVRAVLRVSDVELNYATAQFAFDQIIDPTVDLEKIEAQLRAMSIQAREIAGPSSNEIDKLKAVRQVIYDAGKWNNNSPFSYDHGDPFGLKVKNKLLSTYLQSRRGNCVSMPILHLILAERLGLNVHLSTAPLHMFVRYTHPSTGRSINIEATSGGHPARDIWYRQKLPISDHAIQRGLYLRTLTKRESIAHMATTVLQYLMDKGQYHEAIKVSDVILEHYSKDGYTFAKQANAAYEILERDFREKYPPGTRMPPREQVLFEHWNEINRLAYNKARSLGWEPVDVE